MDDAMTIFERILPLLISLVGAIGSALVVYRITITARSRAHIAVTKSNTDNADRLNKISADIAERLNAEIAPIKAELRECQAQVLKLIAGLDDVHQAFREIMDQFEAAISERNRALTSDAVLAAGCSICLDTDKQLQKAINSNRARFDLPASPTISIKKRGET